MTFLVTQFFSCNLIVIYPQDPKSSKRYEKDHLNALESNKKLKLRVGDRISVFWDSENRSYSATINKEKLNVPKCFHVVYDDGDKGWINPNEERIVLLSQHQQLENSEANDLGYKLNSSVVRKRDNKISLLNKEETSAEVSANFAVGDRIAVFWDEHQTFFNATITEKRPELRHCLHLLYDDGEEEWINPTKEHIKRHRRVTQDVHI